MFKGAPLPALKMLYFLGLIYNEIKVLPEKALRVNVLYKIPCVF